MDATLSATGTVHTGVLPGSLWLNNKKWDLTFISLSAALVILPFAAYETFIQIFGSETVRGMFGIDVHDVLDYSRNTVNGLIALLIGGPHMYATYTRTFLDGDFRKRHIAFLAGSLIIPFGVVYLGIVNFQLLITFFFFWASVHVMHQIAYIIDCYNNRYPKPLSLQSKVLDYVVVFSSLYPLGVWRMIHNTFTIGKVPILFPRFMMLESNPGLAWGLFLVITVIFATSLTLWLWRSYNEYRRGVLHGPKFLLMALTIVIAFFIPSYRELDVSFQGFNTWHSFQYLGLTLYINQLRQKKQGINTPLIRTLSLEGKGWKFYAFNVACALGAVLMITVLLVNKQVLGFNFDQCYYVVVLSFLLMHYYHDHLLFTQINAVNS